MNGQFLKRGFDFVMAAILIVGIAPVIFILSVLGFVFLRGNPFFYQRRPGLHGRIFGLIKFRTMTNTKNSRGEFLPDAQRLTAWGRFLRSTSFDELPQLWNVLIGEMSLIGPRPLLPEYLEIYSSEERRRHSVRPGITGWAQVNGRNATSWDERLKQDVWYVENWSFDLDLKILWMTFLKVMYREGVMNSESVTMPNLLDVRRGQAKG